MNRERLARETAFHFSWNPAFSPHCPAACVEAALPISKRHLASQFPRFLRHPLGLGLQAGDLFLQFLLLRGGDGVDHGRVFLVDLDALFEDGDGIFKMKRKAPRIWRIERIFKRKNGTIGSFHLLILRDSPDSLDSRFLNS